MALHTTLVTGLKLEPAGPLWDVLSQEQAWLCPSLCHRLPRSCLRTVTCSRHLSRQPKLGPPTHPTVPSAPTHPTGPTTPAAPSSCKKSQKKKKAAEARAAAQEGGDEAAGRVGAIEALTRAGHRALALGAAREAVGCFRKALLLSRDTASPQLHRACAFNLGAAYVETGKPRKGFEFLLQSQPSEAESGDYSGSLYFSVGAAHEGLQDFPKALECFEQVPGHAGAAQAGSRAGTCVQMGCCYLGMREPARAARCFLDAAQAYAAAESPGAAAVALSRASGSMLQSRRFRAADIAGVLARCRSLCESIPDPALRGKLYSDIGLGYSQLHIFSLAAESFERALGLCGGERDRQREAALLQNLGAALNALRSFGTALGWHRRAAALHGALGNRRGQGQSFWNLAFACSQLGKHGDAAESYLHALKAFRDSGDLQGQWQACEGLGAACLHLGDPQKAIGHYQEALVLLSRCQDSPRAAHKRVVHKLTDAIQHRLHLSHLSYPNPGLHEDHQPPAPGQAAPCQPPAPRDNDPAAGCWSRRGPRTATRTLSLVCSLV
ncbi:tetratricopeptide repeat protein 24 [Ammospiza caudacuta]|uniref:tetratricopeptide repeat protein 24 n=1 Tax=Ammospiza caudacuta TaxID=2857398 RepID=UPI00273959B8|nr:tetratricopeptide repeat protein 24 [Ammospiza caudacuta]